MSKISFQKVTFYRLKQYFDDRVFAVPHLQRNYVWDANRVIKLLDSIYNHYPIGVSLIWKTSPGKSMEIRTDHKTLIPPYNINNRAIEFIIDGQQRLSSLYGVMNGIDSTVEENSKIDFKAIYFDLDRKSQKRFIYRKNWPGSDDTHIQMFELLNNRPSSLRTRYKLNLQGYKELQKCYNQFTSYYFYFLLMETNSLEEVRETFVRINSQGMTVSKADALFAKSTKIGLRDLVEASRRSLSNGFNKLPSRSFIYTLALARDETRIGAVAMENFYRKFEEQNVGKSEFQKEWKQFQKAFTMAKDYLQSKFSISEYKLLPSDNLFTMLSLFFYLNNKRPSQAQAKEINKWFWHTVLGERYSGAAFNRNIPKDVTFLKQLARKPVKYQIEEKINALDFLKKDYRQAGHAVKGYFLFLRLQKPKYLENGDVMILDGASAMANRKDKHHLFPQNLLGPNRANISSKWIHAIANICLLAANENQRISDAHPKNYLEPYCRERFYKSVMKSHLIPVAGECGIWGYSVKQGYKRFLTKRGVSILSGLEDIAGADRWKMFTKLDGVVRIS